LKFEVYFYIPIKELFLEGPFGGWIGLETELV
jgi:hypothetical protein